MFNWRDEAARFSPKLKIVDYTGTQRDPGSLAGADLVLTTYGTLRRDAARLHAIEFDYAILDEAQAIKNAATASAKSARLLRARYRLALSGTPIENHLGELWSLFEFLNPGCSAAEYFAEPRATAQVDRVANVPRCGHSSFVEKSRWRLICEKTEQTLVRPGARVQALRRAARHIAVAADRSPDGVKAKIQVLECRSRGGGVIGIDRSSPITPAAKLDGYCPNAGR